MECNNDEYGRAVRVVRGTRTSDVFTHLAKSLQKTRYSSSMGRKEDARTRMNAPATKRSMRTTSTRATRGRRERRPRSWDEGGEERWDDSSPIIPPAKNPSSHSLIWYRTLPPPHWRPIPCSAPTPTARPSLSVEPLSFPSCPSRVQHNRIIGFVAAFRQHSRRNTHPSDQSDYCSQRIVSLTESALRSCSLLLVRPPADRAHT